MQSIKPVKTINVAPTNSANGRALHDWWLQKGDEIASGIFSVVNTIDTNQNDRKLEHAIYALLYSNRSSLRYFPSSYFSANVPGFSPRKITRNLIKTCVDTLASKIAKNKPAVQFLTDGGDYSLQRRAKNLTKYINGVFYLTDIYAEAQKVFLDCALFGNGIMYIDSDDEKIVLEHVLIDEIRVDDLEALNGSPRSIYRVKYLTKDVAKSLYPTHKEWIDSASSAEVDFSIPTGMTTSDMIQIVQAWHLPDPGKQNGTYVSCINNRVLDEQVWTKEWFPFEVLRFSDPITGWYADGVASQIAGIQGEVNNLLRKIQRSMELISNPRIFVENQAQIASGTLTNQIGAIIRYSGGNPPIVYVPPQSMPNDVFQHIDRLERAAYEQVGLSQLSASGKKPPGIESAVALRELNDIESERFVCLGQRWENFFVNIAKKIISLSEDLYKKNKKLGVLGIDKKSVKYQNWEDVRLDDDSYAIQAYPVSNLPSTPAGRLAYVQELVQSGFAPKEWALSLLGFPDTESFVSLQIAALEKIQLTIEQILDEGKYNPPDSFDDLNLAAQVSHAALLKAQVQRGIPPENILLLRNYILEVEELIAQQNQPAEPNNQLSQDPQLAKPEALPTSDLIPQQPINQ